MFNFFKKKKELTLSKPLPSILINLSALLVDGSQLLSIERDSDDEGTTVYIVNKKGEVDDFSFSISTNQHNLLVEYWSKQLRT